MPKDFAKGADDHGFARDAARYGGDRVLSSVAEAARIARAKLVENRSSIDASGLIDERTPWFDAAAFTAPHVNGMTARHRRIALERKAYEFGVAFMYMALAQSAVIDDEPDDVRSLVLLRSGEVYGWFHLLVPYSWRGLSMSLGEFKDTGDYLPDTTPAKARKKLIDLSRLGFVTVAKPDRRYVITAGPVAKHLYEEVWFPVVEQFSERLAPAAECGR